MKYEDYIKKLDNLHEEFEEGLLWDLQEKPPTNLHGEIMKSINKGRKRVNFFNYRIYAPAVAAVLVFAVLINKPEILEKINFVKNSKITQKQNIELPENSDPKNNLEHNDGDNPVTSESTDVAINTPNTQLPEGITTDYPTQSPTSDSKNTPQQKNVAIKDNENIVVQPDANNGKTPSEDNIKGTVNLPVKNTQVAENNANEESQLSMKNIWGMLFFKEPETNYEIILDENRSEILNFITENNEEKLSGQNTYKLSLEQFDNLNKLLAKNNINKKLINESAENTSRVIKLDLVNYYIEINDSMPTIIKFIEDQDKCIKIDKNTYKMAKENMNELNKMLNSSGIKKELISESEDENVIVKTRILNYEIGINSGHTDIASFLKNTEKCKPVKENIYEMSRENFNKLKEILTNLEVDFKVLNETIDQDILIKVNNI